MNIVVHDQNFILWQEKELLSAGGLHPGPGGLFGRFFYFTVNRKELQIFCPRSIMGVSRERKRFKMEQKRRLRGWTAIAAALIALAAMAAVLGHCISRYSCLLYTSQTGRRRRWRSFGRTTTAWSRWRT